MCRLTSLKELYIDSCPRITSFPQGMESLASLEKLCISRLGGIVLARGHKRLHRSEEIGDH